MVETNAKAEHLPEPAAQRGSVRGNRSNWLWGLVGVGIVALAVSVAGFGTSGSRGGELSGWTHDFAAAMKSSAATGKPMLVDFGAQWCAPCRELQETVLPRAEVASLVQSKLIAVSIDLTDPGSPDNAIAERFGIQYFPTLVLVGADGKELSRLTGLQSPEELVTWITRNITPGTSAGKTETQPDRQPGEK